MQRDEFGKMGEVIRIRLPLHLETEVRIKANELSGRDRGNMSQVIRDAIYSYFNSPQACLCYPLSIGKLSIHP
jgi:hypothetical protein